MLDGDGRGREKFGEIHSHVGRSGSAFEVTKHLGQELAGNIDSAAFRRDTEALVEIGVIALLAVRVDYYG